MEIIKADIKHAKKIASIHKNELKLGFISTFNLRAIELIYSFIISEDYVFVAIDGDNVIGFVAGTKRTSGLFKDFIKKHGIKFIGLLLPRFFSPSFIMRVSETLFSPGKSAVEEEELPELLTIAVDSSIQAKGVGKLLLDALEGAYMEQKIDCYKVVAGGVLESANQFYQKYGFELSKKVELHKGMISNIYTKKLS